MTIARNLKTFLAQKNISYDVVEHARTSSSTQTAQTAHVPGNRLAKAVVLEDDDGFVLAVVPSSYHVELGILSKQMERKLRLASESQLPEMFGDCELGAVPPVGDPYGLKTVVEEDLAQQVDVYFEAGDHEKLIHVTHDEFQRLMSGAEVRHFSHRI